MQYYHTFFLQFPTGFILFYVLSVLCLSGFEKQKSTCDWKGSQKEWCAERRLYTNAQSMVLWIWLICARFLRRHIAEAQAALYIQNQRNESFPFLFCRWVQALSCVRCEQKLQTLLNKIIGTKRQKILDFGQRIQRQQYARLKWNHFKFDVIYFSLAYIYTVISGLIRVLCYNTKYILTVNYCLLWHAKWWIVCIQSDGLFSVSVQWALNLRIECVFYICGVQPIYYKCSSTKLWENNKRNICCLPTIYPMNFRIIWPECCPWPCPCPCPCNIIMNTFY